jgi:hypothetical protein
MKKRSKKTFDAVQVVKEIARERIGQPPSVMVVGNKKKKREKHKRTLDILREEG